MEFMGKTFGFETEVMQHGIGIGFRIVDVGAFTLHSCLKMGLILMEEDFR